MRGVKYPCYKFKYVATTASDLKKYIESKHKRVRYPCDKWKYAATTVSYLKKHDEIKPEGGKYPCTINVNTLQLHQVI